MVKAHSAGLFGKGEATTKDCRLNPEAGEDFTQLQLYRWLFCQAIFAVLSVTPTERLSEQVLGEGILLFWQNENKVPAGIELSAMEALAGKLALGLRKVASKFKLLQRQSPENSKDPGLTQLKKRLSALRTSPEKPESKPEADADSVEVVAEALQTPSTPVSSPAAPTSKVDWVALAAKLKKSKAEEPPAQASRPVPTPARSSHVLPEHVVETMKQCSGAVQPFSTANDAADDDAKATGEDEAEQKKALQPKPVPKAKSTAAKTASKKKKKTKKGEVAGDEEEKGLALAQPPETIEPAASSATAQAAAAGQAPTYVPGEFRKIGLEFIRKHQAATGVKWTVAKDVWMRSNERASLLASVSPSQMKKRRFE
eukprot:Skav223679  [mRNA]  locus=scaffold2691:193889:194998:- [translate_table: standard]